MKQNDDVNTMEILMAINTGLAFILELAMLVAFGYWGFHGDKSVWMKWVLGIGTPLAVAILWGLILAPRASRRLNITARSILSLALFCIATAALYQSGQPALAITFAVIAVINRVLLFLWKQW